MPVNLPSHADHPAFYVADGCRLLAGRPPTEIADQVGRTPYYVYDRAVMTRKVAELCRMLPADIHLHYAIKANPMPSVVYHMLSLVDGPDVAPTAGMRVALDASSDPARIRLAGPGQTDTDLLELPPS